MIKVGEIELSKTSDIFIMDALVKTIENNFNDFSIIFSFDDVLMTILSDILFTQHDVDLLFSQTSLFKETIINNKFKVHNLSELNHLLELNQTYRILFNNSKKEIKYSLFDFLNNNKNKLVELNLDFDSEEIQVHNIDSINQLNEKYKKERNKKIVIDKVSKEQNVDFDFLVTELKKMYKTAPEGFQMTYVHLFGIRYAVELSKHSLKKIAIEATSKDSLHVEIGKGVKLAEYVVEKRDDFENISDSKIDLDSDKLTYKIDVTGKDLKNLIKNHLVIEDNKRYYFYFANDDDNKWIKSGSTPTYFECLGFKWIGSNWKDLMTNFTKWYLEIGIKSKEDYLNMITEFSKQEIFSTEQKINYLGPFKNNLYINGNHTSIHMWWQILELLKNLSDEMKDSAFVKIHYPSAVEPEEIIKFIWKKEIDAFKKFIVDKKLGESGKIIESVKKLNTIYRKRYPNWYLFLIDDMQDMSNAFSRIRKMQSFLKNTKEFNSTLGYIIDFKKLLDYDDFDFRGYI